MRKMSPKNNDDLKSFILRARGINSRVFKLTRILILMLTWHIKDGIQYREFKSFLDISDGKLYSNLKLLKEMGYIKQEDITLDQKSMHIYLITELGKKELEKIISWILQFNKMM
jgi:DNA-binding MarR family transcriptional regulator